MEQVGQTFTRFIREMMYISDNVFYMSLSFLFLVFCLMIIYWFYTRRKMHELKHQIPAKVLKNYLDSVIENSNALKSSLFRGGGLETTEGIPSVFPTSSLPAGNVRDNSDELARKNAEISSLHSQITNKNQQIIELERMLKERPAASGKEAETISKLNSEIVNLQSLLDAARADVANAGSGGVDPEVVSSLENEKKELLNRLKEYEIIEEDLANLRRLQQENEQLKETISKLQSGAPAAAPAPAPVAEAAPAPAAEPEAEISNAPVEDSEEDLEAAMAAAISESKAAPAAPAADDDMMVPSNEGEQKSAEELLSEFEKMLG